MDKQMGVKNRQAGFSLLEVLVFVSIVSLFFVAASAVATFSLRNLKSNENKILATRFAEELVEWVRGEKEADWVIFTGKTGTYCMDQSPIVETWPGAATCGANENITGTIFKREMSLSSSGEGINLDVAVSWAEGTKTFIVPIETGFERFE